MDPIHLAHSNQLFTYLYGWKSLAKYFGITVRTLQRWNQDLKIPWEKNYKSQQARVKIHILVADKYYRLLQKLRNDSTFRVNGPYGYTSKKRENL